MESVLVLASHSNINVNAQDEYGISPLMRATMNGEYEIVKILLKHKALDVNAEGLVLFEFIIAYLFVSSNCSSPCRSD